MGNQTLDQPGYKFGRLSMLNMFKSIARPARERLSAIRMTRGKASYNVYAEWGLIQISPGALLANYFNLSPAWFSTRHAQLEVVELEKRGTGVFLARRTIFKILNR